MRKSMFGAAVGGSLLLALFLLPGLHSQQLARGSIGGAVTDPSGRAVANVVITLANASQGTERSYTTKNDGVFSFATLEAANYTLSAASSSGFAAWRQPVSLEVGQTRSITIRLEVAGNRTSVEVDAAIQQGVNTTTSDLGA